MNLKNGLVKSFMGTSPLVSIILPIYNVEAYLPRCLESIKRQTYRKFEAVMVNDGSTDTSREIAMKYALEDNRFKLVDRPNGGLSAARNTGMANMHGDYVVFVDSDDWAEPSFIEELLKSIISNCSDMACCRLRYVNLQKNSFVDYGKPYRQELIEGSDIAIDALLVKNIHTPVWAKIYNVAFLKKHRIEFYEGIVNEDTLFTTLVTLNAKRVSFVDKVLFNSLERLGSISRSSQERLFRDMAIVMSEIESYMRNNGHRSNLPLVEAYEARYVKAMLYNLLQSAQRLPYGKFMEVYRLCMRETLYKKYVHVAHFLPLRHRVLSHLSLNPYLFLSCFALMRMMGFRMH